MCVEVRVCGSMNVCADGSAGNNQPGFDVGSIGRRAIARNNVNLTWLKPLMRDLRLIELFCALLSLCYTVFIIQC